MTNRLEFTKQDLKKIPKDNGVYIFYSDDDEVLYVGKAKDLRSRVSSYTLKTVTGKTRELVKKTASLSFIKVGSELESLLLEARLVKKHQPKYNIRLKDDKHPLYIRITAEEFPRVLTARREDEVDDKDDLYGPFPSSRNVRTVLRMLRRIFPFAQHKREQGKACFYNQIGLCDPCPNTSDRSTHAYVKKEYNYNIKMIRGILNGRFNFVKKNLQKQMKRLSKDEDFEAAQKIKKKTQVLEYITQPKIPPSSFLKNPNMLEDIRVQELEELEDFLSEFIDIGNINRIECFDVAHLQGSEPTASMVTFIDGEPEKALYRRFKIRQPKGSDDVASLQEVANRRVRHLADWGIPDLIVVDGGRAQAGTFKKVFSQHNIPVVGLAKRFESIVIATGKKEKRYIVRKIPRGNALNLVKRLRDEAHRFARSYHHKLLEKLLISQQ